MPTNREIACEIIRWFKSQGNPSPLPECSGYTVFTYGENDPAWDKLQEKIEAYIPSTEGLREKIFKRDKTCLHCGTADMLTLHHIIPKSKAPTKARDPDNLMTLCTPCHRAIHDKRYKSIRLNTPAWIY